jgi:orotate phosphoribosyltransferase-like protein
MAPGINEVFPKSRFLHVREATGINTEDLHNVVTVILVDSVINSGKSTVQFVQRIQAINGAVRIVVVAGVVQVRRLEGVVLFELLRCVCRRIGIPVGELRIGE